MKTHEKGIHILDKKITVRRKNIVLEAIAKFNKLPVSALQSQVPILFYDIGSGWQGGHYQQQNERSDTYININTNPEAIKCVPGTADDLVRIICHELGHYYHFAHFVGFTGVVRQTYKYNSDVNTKAYIEHPYEKFARKFASLARQGLTIKAIEAGMEKWIDESGFER